MTKQCLFFLFVCIPLAAQSAPNAHEFEQKAIQTLLVKADLSLSIEEFYHRHNAPTPLSHSLGSVGNGTLLHGKPMPFSGANFRYFDRSSYLAGRCFVHERVREIVIAAYHELETSAPGRQFRLMECSLENGGPMTPHRTHQNGFSVDFMIPKLKNGQPYTELDDLGAKHYLLTFNNAGKYDRNPAITLDFELTARHLLLLEKAARAYRFKIAKVIIKTEFKTALFTTPSSKKLLPSGIYLARQLDSKTNAQHDEHFHIDFEPL